MLGSSFDDDLVGDSSSNIITGGAGNDRLGGDDGNDNLSGGDGNDQLIGGSGNDRLGGDGGNDNLTGGLGADSFFFSALDFGLDIITDFLWEQGDKIAISQSGFGVTSTSQFSYDASTGGLFCTPTGAGGATQFATLASRPAGFVVSLDILLVG